MVCLVCGNENPDGFQFCGFCTARLTDRAVPRSVEERKVVSVLFCDLVGFTAASEQVDPEDVRARLRPYHEQVRDVLERHGGTVEKFVGDAVMAVFGAPVTHEDDAERAVRAGLKILEAIGGLNDADEALSLQARVGINTGEVVVVLGARPELGEAMVTGDVVNTASRLQGAAPVDGVAVSEQTFRATERVFDWEQLDPVVVKGKAEPLAIWRPVAPRARFGSDVTRTHTTPLVGRELEKPLLIGTFERAAQQQFCQLVTLVGEPGVGKSRLCMELFAYLEDRPGLVRWRQGRCLPYGDGISFWALGEIVKAECGILETDTPEQALGKLDRALPGDDPDQAWLLARLAPLVGAGSEVATQEESFAAWRRFLEGLAAAGPAVVVFEDLHWADAALLAFLEHLADWAEGVALLVLCTARPELYEQHPTFGANARNAHRVNLAPLSDEETARLVSALLEQAVLPAETQLQLLERAGGNPLYAEEFVRLLADRGAAEEVPESVQALIAARLDTLIPERKSLLQDAAVMGKTFWAGALTAEEREGRAVEQALHELTRKELVRPARISSMQGEQEYSFWHGLVRDVCYQQIPRASRAARHQAAAAWLEDKARQRAEDLADVLAFHYLTALELTEASGGREVGELREQAVRYLALAGERALPLDVERAEQNLARALALARDDDPQRPELLERWAWAAQQQNRLHEAREALEQAFTLYRQPLAAARVLLSLTNVLWRLGDPRQHTTLAQGLALLENGPPGPDLVQAYAHVAGARLVAASYEEAIAAAGRSLSLADELALPEPAGALGIRGTARAALGEREGLTDIRHALALALDQGYGRVAATQYARLAIASWQYDGPQSGCDACREGIEFCERRGITEFALHLRAESTHLLAELGHVEQALAEAIPVADQLEAAGSTTFIDSRSLQVRLRCERGEHDNAPAADQMLTAARASGEPQMLSMAIAAAVALHRARGETACALALLEEVAANARTRSDLYFVSLLPELVRNALRCRDTALAANLVDGVQPLSPLHEHVLAASRAQLVEAAGNHTEAATLYANSAQRWEQYGNVPERAYALLGHGRCLHTLSDPAAEQSAGPAQELFSSMGYEPALRETQELLNQRERAAS